MELVIASHNIHKIREIRFMLKAYPQLDIRSLLDFPDYKPLEEVGKSFEENAVQKAVHAAKSLSKHTIGDDSGLVVPALHGEPGIYSARYAGPGALDKDNRLKLLNAMKELSNTARHAYYECFIAIASPELGLIKTARGICEGAILEQEKGSWGFGYDSLFLKHEYNKSFAEIEESLKNKISHRRKALDKLDMFLSTFGR